MGLVALQHEESYHTKDWALSPLIGRWILNHWNTREVLRLYIFDLADHVSLTKNNLPNSTRDQIANIHWIIEKAREKKKKKQESSRKTSISALLTMQEALTVWITINYGKFWKRWEYQTTWPASWETYMQVRKQKLELDMGQQTGSKRKRSTSTLYIVTLLI